MKYHEFIELVECKEKTFDISFLHEVVPILNSNFEFKTQRKICKKVYFYKIDSDPKWSEEMFVVLFQDNPVLICMQSKRYSSVNSQRIYIFNEELYLEMINYAFSCINLNQEIMNVDKIQYIDEDIPGLDSFVNQ